MDGCDVFNKRSTIVYISFIHAIAWSVVCGRFCALGQFHDVYIEFLCELFDSGF
jgi:hypothetical protein